MEKSNEFHEKREAQIRSIYNTDEIEYRIRNGDGGSWIKDPYEPETIFQIMVQEAFIDIVKYYTLKRLTRYTWKLLQNYKQDLPNKINSFQNKPNNP